MTFRDRLREELEAQHISKKELASRLGISYSTMLSYIDARGIMPSDDMAVRIAEVLGVSVEYLVTGKNSDLLLFNTVILLTACRNCLPQSVSRLLPV